MLDVDAAMVLCTEVNKKVEIIELVHFVYLQNCTETSFVWSL